MNSNFLFTITLMQLGSLLAMERVPLSPIKQMNDTSHCTGKLKLVRCGAKRTAEDQPKENKPVLRSSRLASAPAPEQVVSPNGKALRRKIATGVKRCIAAEPGDLDIDPLDKDLAPEVLTASPKSLTKTLYVRAMNAVRSKCARLGAPDDEIKKQLESARVSVVAHANKRKASAKKPTQYEQEDFTKLALLFDAPTFELLYDPKIYSATAEGSAVVANASEMKKLTFLQRMAVYAHEITHSKNEDWECRIAYRAAFDAQGKTTQYESSAKPVLYRAQEVFADLIPAAKAPSLAKGIAEYRKNILEEYGKGAPSTHPANGDWAKLDALMVALHEKHKEEQERKERMAYLSQKLREFGE